MKDEKFKEILDSQLNLKDLPNTTKNYDWNNKTYGLTDIEDWKPTGGVKKLINSDRWINLKYNIPSLTH